MHPHTLISSLSHTIHNDDDDDDETDLYPRNKQFEFSFPSDLPYHTVVFVKWQDFTVVK